MNYLISLKKNLIIFNHTSSSTYENICASLEAYEKYGCPPALGGSVQCYCPFTAGEFNLVDVPINIPKVEGVTSLLLNVSL